MAIVYRFLGHATHFFEIGGKKVLVDPFFTSSPVAPLKADQVDPDYVLITHGHFDHIEDAVAIARRTSARVVANFEIANWVQRQGVPGEKVHAQHLGGAFQHPFGRLKFTIAFHGSGLPDGSYGGTPAGFLIEAEGKRLYLTGDTALFTDMQLYRGSGIDLCVLPIGDNFTMGPEDALEALKLIRPRIAVPCHYNTWPLIAQDAQAWKKKVEAALPGTAVRVLAPGDSLEIK
jgi:L-ascorbate metabolism protein UlaG (beta-lactamase superfamily)